MRKLNVNEAVSLNEVINLRPCDGKTRYRIGEDSLFKIADEIGAIVKVGDRKLLYRPKMDAYFERIAE